jgi:Raffinose synthase or seed imbibition protein Sip1
MFQTSHPYASFHAAARCISGGPIYITDGPGKHDIDIIRQMTARTAQGNTVTLRPSLIGKTTEPYTGYEEERLLKVSNFNGLRGTGTSLLAVFNVSKRSIMELIPLKSFIEICRDKEYIVRAHTTGEISKILSGDSQSETSLVALDLPPRGWEILSAYPVRSIQHGNGDKKRLLKIVNLGLLGKMTGAVAVLSTEIKVPDGSFDKLRLTIRLKTLGVLGSPPPSGTESRASTNSRHRPLHVQPPQQNYQRQFLDLAPRSRHPTPHCEKEHEGAGATRGRHREGVG